MSKEVAAKPPQAQFPKQGAIYALSQMRAWLGQRQSLDAAKTAFGVWLALRLYCSLIGGVLFISIPSGKLATQIQTIFARNTAACPHYLLSSTGLDGALAGIWWRWDTPWYGEIAAHGYTCYGSSAFMPLYPLLMRGLGSVLGGNLLAAALVISSLASFVAFYLLYLLAHELSGSPAIARTSVTALALFPTSFFLMAGYTEALFLALAIGSYLAARRGSWWLAGTLAALATLTRLQGIFLLVPLGLELWLSHRSNLRRWQSWLALCLAPGALALYTLFIWLTQGVFPPWGPLSSVWGLHYAWPWQGIGQDLGALISQPELVFTFKLLDPLAALLFAIAAIVAFRRLNRPLAGFLVIMWLSSVIKVNADGYTTSISRYMLALFPTFLLLGMLLDRWPHLARLGAALVAGLLLTLYLLIFLLGGWVA